ncbi:malate dehydrogenase (oxaloacetate-decarboxylating) [Clostridium saccharoperbutylacetonicum]|uniref:Malate dehydrogenase (Oxaloacetate-decarboxylating) (NADP(+)) n=1 Tax=Clostridium saccharoperbutylacetonicum N1-4(HMT) TaxID=931276 RepID=M1LY40_9CLOT|nr:MULTISPECIES: malic enzyme-like NAD(P)-binding protein [Clostridium]AGF58175.1 malate dehydrogenase (oxaloacetate-decarboxylating) (NADP(+)) [Clostridium saccharoperbutylacetonicum N1-4(HMT)]NRT61051.1 malate dehydrogenase (oxaloacetate-decarboxylating) [Clostridium saccharoperbutylacetonicum]NSB24366.1 malate dehydrogenase (oxaloacetate-decarboxylating) [Clostridium saccharoperbutylacetonicum]NSB43742.1 malate dehydrogenase (oxaloacetate-decarboxylating) [Clostridium saccharoperbutylacetoni
MNVREESLRLHREKRGKLEIIGTMPITNGEDLALAYTPGVAEPCLEIAKNKDNAYQYTIKGKTVAVITNGTAVLGLGNIGPEAGLPVVEGKALLLKRFGNVDAIPISLDSIDPDDIVNTIKNISPGFGGIHLEDIKAPECFYIEDKLKELLDIPVYHDDQHGTAIAVLAGLYNALKLVKKDIKDIKVVINGAGASGIAVAKLLMSAGVQNIVLCDLNGAVVEGDDTLNEAQAKIAKVTNRGFEKGSLSDVIKDKDVFVGVSDGNVLTKEMVETMNKDSIVFALANPVPEIMPAEAKAGGAKVVATGRSDFPNQINNVLVFPGIFNGVLKVRAKEICDDMKIAAAKGIANLVSKDELKEDYIIPSVFNKEVCEAVSKAVVDIANEQGFTREYLMVR